jgi:hypothetical protein
MRFSTEATFRGIDLDTFEKLYFDEDFNDAMCRDNKLSRTVIKYESDDERLERVLRIGPERTLPAPMKKILKSDRLEYEERLSYKWGSLRATWEVIPSVMASKVTATGSIVFKETGSGIVRIADGDIRVKLLGVGGVVEKLVVGDVEKSFVNAGRFTQRWIDDGKVSV